MKFLALFQRIARWMAMVLAVVAAGSCMAKRLAARRTFRRP
jgi:hypothetical protein